MSGNPPVKITRPCSSSSIVVTRPPVPAMPISRKLSASWSNSYRIPVPAMPTNIRPDDLDPEGYAVARLKESRLFDRIVLAGADLPENAILQSAADRWGIECHLGSVNDVVERMIEVARKTDADVFARVLLDWFYVDTDLIAGMLEMLESRDLDYVNLPYDFDIKSLLAQAVGQMHGAADVGGDQCADIVVFKGFQYLVAQCG